MRCLLVGLGFIAGLAAAGVRPAAAGTALLWHAPPGCPTDAALRPRIDEQLGRPMTTSDQLAARVTVSSEPDGFHAALEIAIGRRVFDRQVTGVDCDAVVSAVALVLAMLVREVEQSIPPPAPPPPPRAVDVIVPSPPRASSPSCWSASARVAAAGEAGTLPGAGAGAAAAVALACHHWRAEVHGSGWLSRRARLVAGTNAGADVGLLAVGLRACRERGTRLLCATAEVGALDGRGVGIGEPRAATLRWSAAGAAIGTELHLGPHIAAVLLVEGLVAIERPRFSLDDGTLLHRPAPLTVRLSIAFETRTRR